MAISLAALIKSLVLRVNSYLQEAIMLYDWFCQKQATESWAGPGMEANN